MVVGHAPNILRVTISKDAAAAKAAPGYGFIAKPDPAGWTANQSDSEDVYKSDRLVVTIHRPHPNPGGHQGNLPETAKYFSGSAPWANIVFKTPDGKQLLEMRGWDQADYNQKDGTATVAKEFQKTDPPMYTVGASFTSPDDEHYYGLGQNHEGFLDHRGHTVRRRLIQGARIEPTRTTAARARRTPPSRRRAQHLPASRCH